MRTIDPQWPAPACVRAFTTTRPQPDMASVEALLPENTRLCSLQQEHGTAVVNISESPSGVAADACFSRQALHACHVVTADCLPLLICNRAGTEVAAIHAGWRGLAAGVVENCLSQLCSKPEDLLVWLGPAISRARFEVGEEVLAQFIAAAPTASLPGTEQCFQTLGAGKYLADLYALARIRLRHRGVSQLFGGEYCTYQQADLFHSYRRDSTSRRMISVIAILSVR